MLKHQCFATEKSHLKDKNIFKYQLQIYLTWDGKRMVIISGHKKHFLPKYWNRPSPHDNCGGRAPTDCKIQPSEKNVHLLRSSSRSVSCCAWLKEQSGAQTKQDQTSNRQAPCTPEWQCWSTTTKPSIPVMFYLYNSLRAEPEAAVRLWMGITDKPECLGPLLGNSGDLKMAPQYGQAEEQLCPRPDQPGQNQPCTEPGTGTLRWLWSRTSREKHTLGSHVLLETMWQCHLPAGAAGTLRMHQLLRKTSRNVNSSGEKSMQRVTPNISSI